MHDFREVPNHDLVCIKIMHHGQQVKEGDSALLLCFHEIPPAVLCSALEPQQK